MSIVCRVINGIQAGEVRQLFNPENVFLSTHGGGAGNNWASGYHQAEDSAEDILDMLGVSCCQTPARQAIHMSDMSTHAWASGNHWARTAPKTCCTCWV